MLDHQWSQFINMKPFTIVPSRHCFCCCGLGQAMRYIANDAYEGKRREKAGGLGGHHQGWAGNV